MLLILQTVNDNEYQAAVVSMDPPSENFARPVTFPVAGMVVGKFAKKKVALIQTMPGPMVGKHVEYALKKFSNACFIVGVGVCYAFDEKECKLADALVSEKIADFEMMKFLPGGGVEDRGSTVSIVYGLTQIFCVMKDPVIIEDHESNVHVGTICSPPILMNNRKRRDEFRRTRPRAIGGEMEGGELLKFVLERKIEGVILIKGVSDYGDGTKSKDWQFSAAMAALHFAKRQLSNVSSKELPSKLCEGDDCDCEIIISLELLTKEETSRDQSPPTANSARCKLI